MVDPIVLPAGMSGLEAHAYLALLNFTDGRAREYRFHPRRQWRFDFAWPRLKVALEIEGGIWSKGRHTRGAGFQADCVKYNTAVCEGWKVLRVTPKHIGNGQMLEWVSTALASRGYGSKAE